MKKSIFVCIKKYHVVMEIRNLENVNFDVIFRAFEEAFADYAVKFSENQIRAMLIRRGFNPVSSFAVFNAGCIVAFTLNGTGIYNGVQTAYDTGTGTLKAYRGMGLAQEIFHHSIPFLKQNGIEQYLLEVLEDNEKAISVYRKLGFKVTREFNCFNQRKEDVHIGLSNSAVDCRIVRMDMEKVVALPNFCDFHPSWQNGLESIRRAGKNMVCLAASVGSDIVGYCIFEPAFGDLTQIAVAPSFRRKGIASLLLKEMLKMNDADTIKVLNVDAPCCTMTSFLRSKNIHITNKQFEMTKLL